MLKDEGSSVVLGARALLLDLDGTLANSVGVIRDVYREFLLARECVPTDEEFETLNGPPLREIVRRVKNTHALRGSYEELLELYQLSIDDHYGRRVEASEGAREVLARARELGYITAVVTSNSQARSRAWLAKMNLLHFVDHIVAAEDVITGKPNPEPYLAAIRLTGCPTDNCVAVEDSIQGSMAAVGAGLRTFVLSSKDVTQDAWPTGIQRLASLADLVPLL